MALFHYKASNVSGEVQQGEMEAEDTRQVIIELQRDQLIPLQVKRITGLRGLLRYGVGSQGKKIGHKQILSFAKELATLLKAGLPLEGALSLMARLSSDDAMSEVIDALNESIKGGNTFSRALEKHKEIFPRLFISMIKAGEAGGMLGQALDRITDYMERSQALRESVRSALIYPTILLLVAAISVMVLLIFVVPQFSQMFQDMGRELPLPTQVVLAAGDFLKHYWWLLLAFLLLGIALFRTWIEKAENRYRWDRWLLRVPLVGDLLLKVETARLSRTLSSLLHNGLTLLNAVTLSQEVLNNRYIAQAIDQAAQKLKQGKGLSAPLIEQRVLPELAIRMLQVGEESGDIGTMLADVADVYDREVRETVQRLLTLVEPVLIVGLGLIIAGIIISILLAMLSVNDLAF
ncbi:MAG: type II secretion system F family protein [Candidatus Thiodiazotropha sp. (ex Lucinoma annulata)]|nr:type II secretion system F family protein [Candidatus Thiodiazotropha sp. (ex Lucinoma borealis)]MCU7866162.1 type II secretion system F family protein [Candidatus Thiodiazotropha sp. (ex Lucinoma borealis)]MCU7885186.1 type II secretion system F family protein [Candidatus Thiodiazotropha sp. (ex Lucinoma annulata)]MCU7947419.1 type II secretion system F family protein [Candidatus Thiodiazotropha sp. (ex Cardiolucina cf. quadrata)]